LLELGVGAAAREVDHRSERSGDPDAVALTDFVGTQAGGAVDVDAGTPARVAILDCDVDVAGLGWVGEDLVEIRGGSMAEDPARPAGEDRAHLARVAHLKRPHDVDPAEHGAQLVSRQQPLHDAGAQPGPQQLPPRHDPALRRGQLTDQASSGVFPLHMKVKAPLG
jgi:hypothetical protein